uniref:Proline/serine-rich coiled-coil protein 1 isoform X2 n=1 Tax=Geotrypetes seraphini TaxID=260995 RepID=A0A6P8PG87_GEOSA|nr:proline/serine-rich coiled-coil protein 1 isoform X2 [Geotrypetes seraphini]
MERINDDIVFISDEKLDFGIYSPDSRDEDEVVIDPIQHVERCVAQTVNMNVQNDESRRNSKEAIFNWSPLSAEKLEEIMKEANHLATQLENCALREKENPSQLQGERTILNECSKERTPNAKVRLLQEQSERSKSPRSPRRETYLIKESPIKALLPTIDGIIQSPLASPLAVPSNENTPPPVCTEGSPARTGPSPKTGSSTSLSRKKPYKKPAPNRTPDSTSAKQLPGRSCWDSSSRRTSPAVVARRQVTPRLSPAASTPRPNSCPAPQGKAEPVKAITGPLLKRSQSSAATTQSRLLPPKKVTLPCTQR